MRIRVIPGRELEDRHRRRWLELQRADTALDSPYFSPDYVAALAAENAGVCVGLLEDAGQIVGFFPFQREDTAAGRPAGDRLTDLQGVVAAPGARWDARELVRRCGLESWTFTRLLAGQEPFRPYHLPGERRWCAYLDLSQGFGGYVRERARAGSQVIRQVARKRRKLEREMGPVRFQGHATDAGLLRLLMRLKTERFERQGERYDVFEIPWMVPLLERLQTTRTDDFAGLLSVLYVADQPAALHLGIRNRSVLHYCFPAYSERFAAYSPGLILLLALAEHAASIGVQRFDLGGGSYTYKERLKSGSIPLAKGCVTAA